jgi:hypothetical protein
MCPSRRERAYQNSALATAAHFCLLAYLRFEDAAREDDLRRKSLST